MTEPVVARPTTAPPADDGDATDDDVARLGEAIDPPRRIRGASRWPGRAAGRARSWGIEAWVSLAVVAGCVLFVFSQLGPADVLSSSTPAGGDMGAHVWAPAYLRDNLLPSFRLTGWTPDWYAGFPAFQFYMVLPSLAIALLSYVLPYGTAFKLVAISGVLTLPVACWAFGRLTRLPFPAPPLMAVAATAFLFDRSFSIYGGNLASTLAGEFAFSISLSFAVLFLGVVGRGMEDGRHRGWAAVLLALTGLCHLIPFLFALAGAVVWWLVSLARRPGALRRAWWMVGAGAVGVGLTAWWTVPFYLRSAYMNDMGWEKKTTYLDLLFRRDQLDSQLVDAPSIVWVLVLALLGVVMSIAWRRRAGGFLVVMALVAAVAFRFMPQGRLWNARLLPFWYLALYLLAAIGVAELGRTVATLLSSDPARPRRAVTVATAVVASLAAFVSLALPLRALPNSVGIGPASVSLGGVEEDGSYRWLAWTAGDRSFVPSWARWNFTGYEGKAAYPEYHDIVATMADVGASQGCGRAMWEHEEQHDRYGTPMALMLLPFWTDGCIGSMEGLYFEASSTTPYHFLNQDELSTAPSNAQRDLPYVPGPPTSAEFDLGVQHLQMLGVRYYMAISDGMIAQGRANPDLTEVASSGPWVVFEVADSALVEALPDQPAVLTGVSPHDWLDAVTPWYLDPAAWGTWPAAGGPEEWARVTPTETAAPVATTPVAVTDVEEGTDSIEFDVSDVGQPVLVKASYFPNWKADGAEGPWRIGPNLMVVVPTAEHVTLHYGYTTVDYLGWALTVLALVGLVLLVRAGRVPFPPPRPWFAGAGSAAPLDDDGPDGAGPTGGRAEPVVPPPPPGAVGGPAPPEGPPGPPGDAKVPASRFDPAAVILGESSAPASAGGSEPEPAPLEADDSPRADDASRADDAPRADDGPDPGDAPRVDDGPDTGGAAERGAP